MSKAHIGRIVAGAAVVLLFAVVAVLGKAWWDSRLPGTYNVMSYGTHEYGGGPEPPNHAGHDAGAGTSVADLHGASEDTPDARFELTARAADIRLSSGRVVHALTFDGKSPGPELRVKQGDLVEVVLRNDDVEDGVTIHWHGIDVPNAEDGVAGVTQNAVLPGASYTYRFRAEQVGTFWYHTHQVSSTEVRRGLFGVIVIEPREEQAEFDLALAAHTFDGIPTLSGDEGGGRQKVAVGTQVRLRLVNTDSFEQTFTVSGTPFRVLAIDGTDLHEPGELENVALPVGAGGRIDVGYVQPPNGVRVAIEGTETAIGFGPSRGPAPGEVTPTATFDPLTYGTPSATPFDATSTFDRRFELTITRKPGFFDGRPGRQWAINGGIYPDVPVFVVEEGDLVEITITNDTNVVHPMHLHGHHVLVLSRDGVPSTGSPWWSDTLNVSPGESYVVAFRADNPGIWMDHCHNLPHAAEGLTMHIAYAGVSTPFLVGAEHHNTPEYATAGAGARRRGPRFPRTPELPLVPDDPPAQPRDENGVDRMEESDRERQLEADPGEPQLDEEEQEQEAVATEAPLPDACDESDDHEEQPEQNHEVPPARVELEAVEEHVFVDRRSLVLELVRRVERAVAGEPDLHDDRCEEDQRPRPVESSHAFLPVG